jgi:hypothetical protein
VAYYMYIVCMNVISRHSEISQKKSLPNPKYLVGFDLCNITNVIHPWRTAVKGFLGMQCSHFFFFVKSVSNNFFNFVVSEG